MQKLPTFNDTLPLGLLNNTHYSKKPTIESMQKLPTFRGVHSNKSMQKLPSFDSIVIDTNTVIDTKYLRHFKKCIFYFIFFSLNSFGYINIVVV